MGAMPSVLSVKKNTKLGNIALKDKYPKDVRERELDTILKFSALINSSLKIEDVLSFAMQWAEEFMSAEASSVYELDEEKGELFVRIARGKKKGPVKGIKIKLGEGIAGHVVRTGQPMVVQNVHKERIFSNKFDRMTGFRTRSMICVPLVLRDKPIGAFEVLNKKAQENFTPSDLELLTSMSQQIAVAIDNAKFYQRLEKKFELTSQELKMTQAKLIRSERLAAMGHFVQGVAHEIRNPVMTIGGFAGRMKKELNGDPKHQRYIDIIIEESGRLENIVAEVREFTNVLSATLELEDITRILKQVIKRFEPLAQKQRVVLATEIDQNLPLTRMDTSQITTALSNIMENALESMPQGGQLTLVAKDDYDQIVIRILDTGRGISEEHLDSIHDPFFTSKTRGAGLGLTMVHQIIMNHHGEITFDSHIGKGTSVTLYLPVKR